MDKKLVVSNHNSDLEWLSMTYDYGFSPENTIIYDRSDEEKDWSHLGESLRSPNVGENIYDMMRFIVDHYDNLPDISIFIKGNMFQRPEERGGIKDLFRNITWAIVDETRVSYNDFLTRLKLCKFMICPRGNAVDCHRNWEVLYMRRVPVMKRDSYLQELFKDYPVLWVDDFAEVTQTMLMDNYHLYEQAQDLILGELSLPFYFQTTVHKALNG